MIPLNDCLLLKKIDKGSNLDIIYMLNVFYSYINKFTIIQSVLIYL